MVLSFLFKSETEKKRDNYQKLYQKLNERINAHDEFVSEADSAHSSYVSAMPYLSEANIPSDDFEPKRTELTDRLISIYDLEKEKRLQLIIARDRALGRYEYYRQLAIEEAEES